MDNNRYLSGRVNYDVEKRFNLLKKKNGDIADYIIFYRAVAGSRASGESLEMTFDKLVGEKLGDDVNYDAETRRELIEKMQKAANGWADWEIFEGIPFKEKEGEEAEFTQEDQDYVMHELRNGMFQARAFIGAINIEKQALKDFSKEGRKALNKLLRAAEQVEKLEPTIADDLVEDAERMLKSFWLQEIKLVANELRWSRTSKIDEHDEQVYFSDFARVLTDSINKAIENYKGRQYRCDCGAGIKNNEKKENDTKESVTSAGVIDLSIAREIVNETADNIIKELSWKSFDCECPFPKKALAKEE